MEYGFTHRNTYNRLFLLAEGFPINLYDSENQSVPDRAIDPIQALLLSSLIKLKDNFQSLPNGTLHVSNARISKLLSIREKELLFDWCYLNDVPAGANPYKFFNPHPLEEILIKL